MKTNKKKCPYCGSDWIRKKEGWMDVIFEGYDCCRPICPKKLEIEEETLNPNQPQP